MCNSTSLKERGQGGPGPPKKEQNGANKEQNWGKGPKWGCCLPLESPGLVQKEQKCFGPPQFYISIARMVFAQL